MMIASVASYAGGLGYCSHRPNKQTAPGKLDHKLVDPNWKNMGILHSYKLAWSSNYLR